MKLALAQLNVTFENKSKNKETAMRFVKQAADEKVDMIFFPEMTLTGFSMNTSLIGENNNSTLEFFKELSYKFNICIGFGYVEGTLCSKNKYSVMSPPDTGGVPRSTLGVPLETGGVPPVIGSVPITPLSVTPDTLDVPNQHGSVPDVVGSDPSGLELVNYSKIHPFSFGDETKFYESGNEIKFFNAFGFTITPFICYDLRFPEIFQIASKTATLITVAANWPCERRDHWITLLKARAIENQCYIAGVNRVGAGNGLNYSGDSMIIDPLGNIISTLYNEEGLVIADIHLAAVIKIREKFRLKDDRKESLYRSMY